MKEIISVIIPAYNSAGTIEKAVRSVIGQSCRSFDVEVIVVNDASKDQTADTVRTLMEELPGLRLIDKPANGGVSAARNDGLRAANGQYIVTLDADDFVDDGMLKDLHDAIRIGDADLSVCGFRMLYPDGRTEEYIPDEIFCGSLKEFVDGPFVSLYDNHLISTHSNKLYRKELIDRCGVYYNDSLQINEDIDFCLRYIACCRRVSVIPGVYLNYVQHAVGQSLNTTFQKYGVSSAVMVAGKLRDLMHEARASSDAANAMNQRMFVHICSFIGLMYYRSGYSDEQKKEELRDLYRNTEFQKLMKDVRPADLKTLAALFLLRRGKTTAYHMLCKALYRSRERNAL